MKSKDLIYLVFFFVHLNLFGQDEIKRLNFILLIDGEIPIATISEGCFLMKDSTGNVTAKLPFNYKVGGLEVSASDYKILFSKSNNSKKFIRFKFNGPKTLYNPKLYQCPIWLNEDYIIMNVYNKYNKLNNEKFDFGNSEYLVQIETSLFTNILRYRADWYRKHKSEIN